MNITMYGKHKKGETVVLAHTKKGQDLLMSAAKEGYIDLRELDPQDIFNGETVDTRHKRKVFSSYLICKENNWKSPYTFSNTIENEIKKEIIHNKKLRYEKILLTYSRKRMLCGDISDINNESKELEREMLLYKKQCKRKEKLLFPFHVIKVLSSKAYRAISRN